MQKWEYTHTSVPIVYDDDKTNFTTIPVPSYLWNKKLVPEGKTGSELISCKGKEGWELVSVTPITECSAIWQPYPRSYTASLLYTFKRLIE